MSDRVDSLPDISKRDATLASGAESMKSNNTAAIGKVSKIVYETPSDILTEARQDVRLHEEYLQSQSQKKLKTNVTKSNREDMEKPFESKLYVLTLLFFTISHGNCRISSEVVQPKSNSLGKSGASMPPNSVSFRVKGAPTSKDSASEESNTNDLFL